jgi:hypothetical protein
MNIFTPTSLLHPLSRPISSQAVSRSTSSTLGFDFDTETVCSGMTLPRMVINMSEAQERFGRLEMYKPMVVEFQLVVDKLKQSGKGKGG